MNIEPESKRNSQKSSNDKSIVSLKRSHSELDELDSIKKNNNNLGGQLE